MLNIEYPNDLWAYLRENERIGPDETPRHTVLTGGVSNRVVRVDRPDGVSWVLKQALPKLRVAVDWYSSPNRSKIEAVGIHWLNALLPEHKLPKLIFQDDALHLLAMEAVPEPHENWKHQLLAGKIELGLVCDFGDMLAKIHQGSMVFRYALSRAFEDRSYFDTLRLEPYYGYTASQLPEAATFLYKLIEETRACRLALVHGDYSPKNMLVYQDRLVLLDHEVIHFGDPAFDIGFSLTHLLAKALHVTGCREAFRDAAHKYWVNYGEMSYEYPGGSDFEKRAVRHTLGCLLARVSGRSPLEYLSDEGKAQQRDRALKVLNTWTDEIPVLIDRFLND